MGQYNFYEQYLKNLQIKAEEAVKEAQKKAFAEYFEVANEKIQDIYKDTISDFYKYEPSFYNRDESLYDLIETNVTDEYLSIKFDPSKISYRNGYSESSTSEGVSGGLYDIVFRQGWHGGAMIDGSMLYPVGIPHKAYDGVYEDGRYKPYENGYRYGWSPAVRAHISPLDDFTQRIDEYHEKEYQQDYNKIWNKYKQNIKIDII